MLVFIIIVITCYCCCISIIISIIFVLLFYYYHYVLLLLLLIIDIMFISGTNYQHCCDCYHYCYCYYVIILDFPVGVKGNLLLLNICSFFSWGRRTQLHGGLGNIRLRHPTLTDVWLGIVHMGKLRLSGVMSCP